MQAAGGILNTAASNIANMYSRGYKAMRINLVDAGQLNGVRIGSVATDPRLGYLDETGHEGSNTDLASDVVHLSMAKSLYAANGLVLRTGSEMTRTLLDIIAK